jgi:alkylation response protein AidB-like acyl-CoA dehydrogenase
MHSLKSEHLTLLESNERILEKEVMEFQLTRSQKDIQKAAKEFAKGEFDKELTADLEKQHSYPTSVWEKTAELGFIGIQFPEVYSGGDMGALEECLIAEELCRKDSSLGSVLMLAAFGSQCIHRYADEALKEKYLPLVAEGAMLAGAAMDETDGGDDLTTLETTAVMDGDRWVISGEKRHVINGGTAGFYVVLCRTDLKNNSEPSASMVLVEKDCAGLSVNPVGDKLGLNMMATADLTFQGVRVPAGNLIGKKGKGIKQAQAFFDECRILAAARATGIAKGAFDRALVYVKQREQFGKKLARFQAIRHKIADMATKIELAKLITYRAAQGFDSDKKVNSSLISMAKITATEVAVAVTDEAIQLLGGYGYMTEQEVERFYRDSKVAQLSLGRPFVQKDNIADAVIGKLK